MKKLCFYALCIGMVCAAFTTIKPKKLFLLGDSISMQYSPYLEKMLAGRFTIIRKQDGGEGMKNLDIPKGSNIGDSRMALSYIKAKLADEKFVPDLITLNCGLHDIKRNPSTQVIAVDTTEYRQNLQQIASIIAKRKITMIWIRTTAVVDSIHKKNKGFDRYAKDLEQYNAIADEVFKKANVRSIDLYSFTKNLGGNRYVDHVHYNDETKALQAAYIAGFLNFWNDEKH